MKKKKTMTDFESIFDKFVNSNLGKIKFKNKDFEVEMEKASAQNGESFFESSISQNEGFEKITMEEKSNFEEIKSPIVGIIYFASSPDGANFVAAGSRVKKGDVLCILEAMKVFNELKAPFDGFIRKINFKNEDLVGEGDVIFEMEKC
ncbi:acetyl-CoA carboxylase biotin carboxyl carrier protein subunit [uncultured Peptoniphilus sp.]|uniref:acetyl-CoA carboxylase biotin carboxyl carrier protein n=1 Tax=uncultured Peptoniphilus sp. TaxID=254354 RepID=UPI0028038F37|nr:acetyl-CoA carboxylase biotin carboxyl carrier protein subunit [uncultured Peptoniphilus sp.]